MNANEIKVGMVVVINCGYGDSFSLITGIEPGRDGDLHIKTTCPGGDSSTWPSAVKRVATEPERVEFMRRLGADAAFHRGMAMIADGQIEADRHM